MPDGQQDNEADAQQFVADRNAARRASRGRPLHEVFAAEQVLTPFNAAGGVGSVTGNAGGGSVIASSTGSDSVHESWIAGLRAEMRTHEARIREIEPIEGYADECDRLLNRNAFIRSMIGEADAPPRRGEPIITTGYSSVNHGDISPLSAAQLQEMVRTGEAREVRNGTLYRTEFYRTGVMHSAPPQLLGWIDDGEHIVSASGEVMLNADELLESARNERAEISRVAAVMGRKGGRIGGPARAAALTPERRKEIARKAALAMHASRGHVIRAQQAVRRLLCWRCCHEDEVLCEAYQRGFLIPTSATTACSSCDGNGEHCSLRECHVPASHVFPARRSAPSTLVRFICQQCSNDGLPETQARYRNGESMEDGVVCECDICHRDSGEIGGLRIRRAQPLESAASAPDVNPGHTPVNICRQCAARAGGRDYVAYNAARVRNTIHTPCDRCGGNGASLDVMRCELPLAAHP